MYNQQAENTTGAFRRQLLRIAGRGMPAVKRYGAGAGKKSGVDSQQRSWRMKRKSRNVLLWLFLPIMICGLGWLAYTVLLYSDIFRMTSVTVKGSQVTTEQQVLKRAGLLRGTNLLTLDGKNVAARIREEPWVDQVWVKRHWPSTVEIIIQEFKPFALVNLERDGNRQLYYMNNKGVVFAPSTAHRDLDYPVVNGAGLVEELEGKEFRADSLGAMALDFLRLTAGGNQVLPTQAVSEINVDPQEGLVVYLVDHPFPIYMGKESIRLRFSRLVRVLARLYRDNDIQGVAEIRMDYGENRILVARTAQAP